MHASDSPSLVARWRRNSGRVSAVRGPHASAGTGMRRRRSWRVLVRPITRRHEHRRSRQCPKTLKAVTTVGFSSGFDHWLIPTTQTVDTLDVNDLDHPINECDAGSLSVVRTEGDQSQEITRPKPTTKSRELHSNRRRA